MGKFVTDSPTAAELKAGLLSPFAALPAYTPKVKKKRSRADKIFLPSNDKPKQESLTVLDIQDYPPGTFPQIGRKAEVIKILTETDISLDPYIGLDFEFNTQKMFPEIIGVSYKGKAAGAYWDNDLKLALKTALDNGAVFVGHFVLGADRIILDNGLGVKSELKSWRDSMLTHYLCYASLCKAPGKGEADDSGALGFMGLSSATGLWTTIPAGYKSCRGIGCKGPCPRHDVLGYCAVDSHAGEQVFRANLNYMREHNIPWKVYEESAYLALNFCIAAEERGINVDLNVIKNLDKILAEEKKRLFPICDDKTYEVFNPGSSKQVLEYFKPLGIKLPNTQRNTIYDTLENELYEKYGVVSLSEFNKDPDPPELDSTTQVLYNLYSWKELGSGTSRWFDKKYFGSDSRLHPRINFTGTSLGRYSSSAPNFQNLTKKGIAKEIKKAIVPAKGMQFIAADAKNLELRTCLYAAGVDVSKITGDMFAWLLEQADGAFDKPAADQRTTPRQIAKMTVHASNYLMGIKLYDEWELKTDYVRNQIKKGALLVYEDWFMSGKVVTFTGRKFAQTLYKNHSDESRARALAIQKIYFDAVPAIRQWHREVTKKAEERFYHSGFGTLLELLENTPEEAAKVVAAAEGQGIGAHYVSGMIYKYLTDYSHPDAYIDMIVHDEVLWEVPKDWTRDQIKKFTDPLNSESHRYKNLAIPWEVKFGPNWGTVEDL